MGHGIIQCQVKNFQKFSMKFELDDPEDDGFHVANLQDTQKSFLV